LRGALAKLRIVHHFLNVAQAVGPLAERVAGERAAFVRFGGWIAIEKFAAVGILGAPAAASAAQATAAARPAAGLGRLFRLAVLRLPALVSTAFALSSALRFGTLRLAFLSVLGRLGPALLLRLALSGVRPRFLVAGLLPGWSGTALSARAGLLIARPLALAAALLGVGLLS
jgi:hypothetical protein